jgi:hypothetical protein
MQLHATHRVDWAFCGEYYSLVNIKDEAIINSRSVQCHIHVDLHVLIDRLFSFQMSSEPGLPSAEKNYQMASRPVIQEPTPHAKWCAFGIQQILGILLLCLQRANLDYRQFVFCTRTIAETGTAKSPNYRYLEYWRMKHGKQDFEKAYCIASEMWILGLYKRFVCYCMLHVYSHDTVIRSIHKDWVFLQIGEILD